MGLGIFRKRNFFAWRARIAASFSPFPEHSRSADSLLAEIAGGG
jgi:hypothetical protein